MPRELLGANTARITGRSIVKRSAMKTSRSRSAARKMWTLAVLVLALAGTSVVRNQNQDEGNPA
jgi:hypothetical protein